MYKIRNTFHFGSVYPVTKKDGNIYYRYYIGEKENIIKLFHLFNGNLILNKRREQFEQVLKQIQNAWQLDLKLKPWNLEVSLDNSWLSGFVDGDGEFDTNQGRGFSRGTYSDGRSRYGFKLKFYITQYQEDPVLLQIRNLSLGQCTRQIGYVFISINNKV